VVDREAHLAEYERQIRQQLLLEQELAEVARAQVRIPAGRLLPMLGAHQHRTRPLEAAMPVRDESGGERRGRGESGRAPRLGLKTERLWNCASRKQWHSPTFRLNVQLHSELMRPQTRSAVAPVKDGEARTLPEPPFPRHPALLNDEGVDYAALERAAIEGRREWTAPESCERCAVWALPY
jgi:hypothetical protein